MTETEPLRILQVGLGNRGRMWQQILGAEPQVTCCGAVDASAQARAAFAEQQPGLPLLDSLEAALTAVQHQELPCDAVLLVTPPDGHLAQAQAVFAAGLPLLAEKPLTTDLAEAVEIVRLAAAHRLPLMVGLNFRYLPVTQAIRKLVAEQALGRPGFAQFTYQRNRDGKLPHLNKYPLTMQHPMMLEQSIHHLDLIRFAYGRAVRSVTCRTWNPAWSMYAHDANVSCLLELEGGLEVNYLGTWTGGWDELQFQWRTDCSAGVIVQQSLFGDLAIAHTRDKALTPVPLAAAEPFYDDTAALLRAFVAHLRGGAELQCSGADHLITLALCFAAIESSATGRTVDFPAFCRRYAIEPETYIEPET